MLLRLACTKVYADLYRACANVRCRSPLFLSSSHPWEAAFTGAFTHIPCFCALSGTLDQTYGGGLLAEKNTQMCGTTIITDSRFRTDFKLFLSFMPVGCSQKCCLQVCTHHCPRTTHLDHESFSTRWCIEFVSLRTIRKLCKWMKIGWHSFQNPAPCFTKLCYHCRQWLSLWSNIVPGDMLERPSVLQRACLDQLLQDL